MEKQTQPGIHFPLQNAHTIVSIAKVIQSENGSPHTLLWYKEKTNLEKGQYFYLLWVAAVQQSEYNESINLVKLMCQ